MTLVDAKIRPWWPEAEELMLMGRDVRVWDPQGAHFTWWDHDQAHGTLTVIPTTGAKNWHLMIDGPVSQLGDEEASESIHDAPTPVAW